MGQRRAKPPKRLLITILRGALIAQWSFLGTKGRKNEMGRIPVHPSVFLQIVSNLHQRFLFY